MEEENVSTGLENVRVNTSPSTVESQSSTTYTETTTTEPITSEVVTDTPITSEEAVKEANETLYILSLIHISEPTRRYAISYAVV